MIPIFYWTRKEEEASQSIDHESNLELEKLANKYTFEEVKMIIQGEVDPTDVMDQAFL